jgi:RNA polymerase sigma factor (sigma-70 family)
LPPDAGGEAAIEIAALAGQKLWGRSGVLRSYGRNAGNMVSLAAPTSCGLAERDALVLRWRFLPRKILADLLRRRPDARRLLRAVGFEDLEQEGLLGLLRAAGRWDRGRGVRFTTFAFPYVLNGIRMETFRQLYRRPPRAPLVSEPAAGAQNGPGDEELYAALARLSAADRKVLEERFGLGGKAPHTYTSIARKCGRTKQAVRKRVAGALARLAACLAALR